MFVLAKQGFVADASGIFQNIYDWAERERCTHLVIDEKHCDVERADIAMEIGSPKRVPTSVVFFPLHHAQDTTDV